MYVYVYILCYIVMLCHAYIYNSGTKVVLLVSGLHNTLYMLAFSCSTFILNTCFPLNLKKSTTKNLMYIKHKISTIVLHELIILNVYKA